MRHPAGHGGESTRLPEFVLGMALAQVVIAGRWRGPGLRKSLAITVAGYFISPCVPAQYGYDVAQIETTDRVIVG